MSFARLAVLRSLLLLPLLGSAVGSTALAAPQELDGSSEEACPAVPVGVEAALEVETDGLGEALALCSEEELREHLDAWTGFLRERSDAVDAADDPARAEVLAAERDRIAYGVEVVAGVLEGRGGDASAARELVAAVHETELRGADATNTVPAGEEAAQSLPVEVLEAQLRPLRREQVADQLEQWVGLLQEKCLAVRNVEVAAMRVDDAARKRELEEQAVVLRGERGRLVERVRVVVDALEEKGGDVEEARAYLGSIVAAPPITRWDSALTTLKTWTTSPDGGLALARRIGAALGLFVAAWIVAVTLARLVARAMRSMQRGLLKEFVVKSVRRVVIFVGLLLALEQLGLDMTPMLAAIGAAGLVIGLALQGTLSNFASGIMIMMYRPFDVGDAISVAGILGKVESMTLVTTRLKTFDNQTMQVPNNMIWGDVITNITANPTRRVDMVFGVSYDADLRKVDEILREVVTAHAKVLSDPELNVRVGKLADSAIEFIVRPWCKTEDYWEVYWDLNLQVKERFDREGISIPFPQRDVHLYPAGSVENGGEGGLLQPAARTKEGSAR